MAEERPFIFKAGSTELILPVIPGSYKVETGVNIEVVNIHQLGDVIVNGYGTLATIKISCLLPANSYSFASDNDPEYYIQQFRKWIEQNKRIRFIVGGTGVNVPVKVQSITQGEEDGTNDIYADIILREHRQLEAVQMVAAADNVARTESKEQETGMRTHVLQYGDTLSALCRKYYGDGTQAVWEKVAAYNNIPNPHLFPIGTVIQFPTPLP